VKGKLDFNHAVTSKGKENPQKKKGKKSFGGGAFLNPDRRNKKHCSRSIIIRKGTGSCDMRRRSFPTTGISVAFAQELWRGGDESLPEHTLANGRGERDTRKPLVGSGRKLFLNKEKKGGGEGPVIGYIHSVVWPRRGGGITKKG